MSNAPSAVAESLPPPASRSKLLAIMAVFIAPVIAAAFAYVGWHPATQSNYGQLLEVVPLRHTGGSLVDDRRFDLKDLQGKWLMVRVGSGACDADCARQLYLMRQTRLMLGKDQGRVERVWVVADDRAIDPALLAAHAGLHAWRPHDAAFFAQLPPAPEGGAAIYLVDPLGNRMLRFPSQPDPKGMLKDLKLLLRASQVG